MVAVRLSTLTGQPGRLITRPETTDPAPTAPVGPPDDPDTPPSKAQLPTAMVARAPAQTSRATSTNGRPPIMQNVPSAAVGVAPSTTAMYGPLPEVTASFRAP